MKTDSGARRLARIPRRLPALAWADAPLRERFPVGAQSYSFRKFDLAGSLACLNDLGADTMEFCRVHFCPDITPEEIGDVRRTIADAGVRVPCYGVEGFGADQGANRAKFEFARALGASVLTADPTLDSLDQLDDLCEEFQVKVAIHNHGPGARYDKVADTLKAVNGRHPFIGACVDTGHYLRSGEQPHEVIDALGDRVVCLHLKDWKVGGDEQILGRGDMDLAAVVESLVALDFHGPIVMEYEESPDNPVPDMRIGLTNWRKAVGEVNG